MPMPAEDAYFQIGEDASRFWSTARQAYVPPDDQGYMAWLPDSAWKGPIPSASEEALSATLTNIGLGHLAPIPPPASSAPRDIGADLYTLKAALIAKGVITQADVTAAATSLAAAPAAVNPAALPALP